MDPAASDDTRAIILFDGVCNLCNGFVNFVIDRDPDGYFKFAALQSDSAGVLLGEAHRQATEDGAGVLQSVVLVEDGRRYRKSAAAWRIARRLKSPWRFLGLLRLLPVSLRDALYDWVATHRYDWFGQRDRCRVPTPELRDRFL